MFKIDSEIKAEKEDQHHEILILNKHLPGVDCNYDRSNNDAEHYESS